MPQHRLPGLWAAFASTGVACTIVLPSYVTGPDFRVQLEGKERGVVAEIGGRRAVTGKDGSAVFVGVPTGSYTLRLHRTGGISDPAFIEVRRTGMSLVKVTLPRPQFRTVETRALDGSLYLPEWLPGTGQRRLSVAALHRDSGKRLGVVQTDVFGVFRFPNAKPGPYLLHVDSPETGWVIAVAVNPQSSRDRFELDLGRWSCGTFYKDRGECPAPAPRRLARLSGTLVDPAGAVVPDAEVFLFDRNGKEVSRTRSAADGTFSHPAPPEPGEYQFVARSPGFSTVRSPVVLDPAATAAPVLIRLRLGGECGVF